MKSYFFLFLAILCELTGTTFLKKSEGFTKLAPSLITVISMIVAFYFLSLAIKTIPVGTAYAIWSGVGIVFITFIGAIFFKQIPDAPSIIGISLIIAGVLIINLFSKVAGH
jgi:small multidrug resistance pump